MDQSSDPPAAAKGDATRASRWRAWRLARIGLVIFLSLLLVMLVFENRLIYFPFRYPEGNWHPRGITFEDAQFEAADGTPLHGWYVPHDDPTAYILFTHGNAGNVTHRAEILQALHDYAGVATLMLDYRGFGRSGGSPDEAGVLLDARAARKWLATRAGIPECQIALMGESLGGAVAVDLAAHDGAAALILDSTFSSAPDVGSYHYRWLPVRWLMRTRFESADKIGNYHGPLLQFHGDLDTIVPIEIGRRLFDAANEPKQWVVMRGVGHNDARGKPMFDTIRQFFENLPQREPWP